VRKGKRKRKRRRDSGREMGRKRKRKIRRKRKRRRKWLTSFDMRKLGKGCPLLRGLKMNHHNVQLF
jgi:hypothetical protein